jgi:hypothetical protein
MPFSPGTTGRDIACCYDDAALMMITHARHAQVLDLYNIAAPAFPGQNSVLGRGLNYMIPLMVHCRYRT